MAKKYSKEKINITIDSELLKKIDEIKAFPHWKDNRSLVIETFIEEGLIEQFKEEATCLVCGCTDSNRCIKSPCHWAMVDRRKGIGVCSSCTNQKKGDF